MLVVVACVVLSRRRVVVLSRAGRFVFVVSGPLLWSVLFRRLLCSLPQRRAQPAVGQKPTRDRVISEAILLYPVRRVVGGSIGP